MDARICIYFRLTEINYFPQVLAEQHEKNTIEDRLSSEIDQLRYKVHGLHSKDALPYGRQMF